MLTIELMPLGLIHHSCDPDETKGGAVGWGCPEGAEFRDADPDERGPEGREAKVKGPINDIEPY